MQEAANECATSLMLAVGIDRLRNFFYIELIHCIGRVGNQSTDDYFTHKPINKVCKRMYYTQAQLLWC